MQPGDHSVIQAINGNPIGQWEVIDESPAALSTAAEPGGYTNYYLCTGDHLHSQPHPPVQWSDKWDCQANDRCPQCDAEIEPYASDTGNGPVLTVPVTWHPARLPARLHSVNELEGWPK